MRAAVLGHQDITLTDDNVLALFAASRELLIPAIQVGCVLLSSWEGLPVYGQGVEGNLVLKEG